MMDFCTCHEPVDYSPVECGPLFAAGVCFVCHKLNEAAALSFLTVNDGANFSLQTSGVVMTDDVAEWLRVTKAKCVEVMLSRLAEITAAPNLPWPEHAKVTPVDEAGEKLSGKMGNLK